ncbi:phosphatidylserine decarboxylase family protein [candidate division KSB1 bacterium]|nr:MAG: phosphatidylserine decarboxylase family protein [candidate division KSB1 bacterium]
MKIAHEAVGVIGPIAVLVVILLLWGIPAKNNIVLTAAALLGLFGLFTLTFFRDPERIAPTERGCVVAPADGRVIVADSLPDGRKHIAIFMSLFDVHVNRTPIAGTVYEVIRTPGKYFHAGTDRAAAGNARVDVEADTEYGKVCWRQVSGLIARKISCRLKFGDKFQLGERFGLIFFGSRMDIFLPSSAVIEAQLNQSVTAGESVIAKFPTEDFR